MLKGANTTILEHYVYGYTRIIPGNNIEWNVWLYIGLVLWIVKACGFDFEFKLSAWFRYACLLPNWLTVELIDDS
jgi:hypothetical protein